MKKPKKNGRPSVYETRIAPYLDVISYMKSEGKTDDFIAKMLGISKNTLVTHKSNIDEFFVAYTQGKEKMVDKIEATVFDIAFGRTQRKIYKERKNAMGQITFTETTIENIPPLFSAVEFILKGLRKEVWNDKVEEVFESPESVPFAERFIEAIDEDSDR